MSRVEVPVIVLSRRYIWIARIYLSALGHLVNWTDTETPKIALLLTSHISFSTDSLIMVNVETASSTTPHRLPSCR